jgi:hypothetical protein
MQANYGRPVRPQEALQRNRTLSGIFGPFGPFRVLAYGIPCGCMHGDMLLAFQVPQGNLKLLDAHPELNP